MLAEVENNENPGGLMGVVGPFGELSQRITTGSSCGNAGCWLGISPSLARRNKYIFIIGTETCILFPQVKGEKPLYDLLC